MKVYVWDVWRATLEPNKPPKTRLREKVYGLLESNNYLTMFELICWWGIQCFCAVATLKQTHRNGGFNSRQARLVFQTLWHLKIASALLRRHKYSKSISEHISWERVWRTRWAKQFRLADSVARRQLLVECVTQCWCSEVSGTVIKLSTVHSIIRRYTNVLHNEKRSMHPLPQCATSLGSNRCRLRPTGDTERSQVRTKRLQWRRYQAVVRIRAWSHIISSRCCLQLPGQRTGWCGEPSPLVPPAGRTAPSPPGCQRAAPRSGRPCLWAAALAGLPYCARFRSQNTQGDLKKKIIKSSLRA